MNMVTIEYLKPIEIASRLRCSEGVVYRMCREGTLPTIRFGRLYRIPVDKFDRWLVERDTKTA